MPASLPHPRVPLHRLPPPPLITACLPPHSCHAAAQQGKSTLTNWLLGSERCLTGPEPGLTRDAIKERIVWEGQEVELVDTAGWIRRTKLANYDESGERLGLLVRSYF